MASNLKPIYSSAQQAGVTLPPVSSPSPWDTPNDNIHALIVPTCILVVICGIGVIGNFCIAWVTFKGSNFQSICYTFIALNAMSSIVLELWNFSYIYYVIHAKYYTIRDCWIIGIVPAYCMNTSIMLTLMTSADRLFIMVAPNFYRSLSKSRYLTITIAIPIITSAYWAFLSYYPMKSQASKSAICVFHNYIQGYVAVAQPIFSFVISLGLLLAHYYLWRSIKTKQLISGTTKKIAKALRTNCIILAIQFSTNLIYRSFYSTVIPKETQLLFSLYIQCFLHIGFASNFFVYFTLSKPYRIAFCKIFPYSIRITNRVEPIAITMNLTSQNKATVTNALTTQADTGPNNISNIGENNT